MLQSTASKSDDLLISVLLCFYVIWKMPIVAVYMNTYIAMILLIAMFALLVVKNTALLNSTNSIYMAAVAYMILTLIDELYKGQQIVNAVWSAFLGLLPMLLGAILIFRKMDRQIRILVPLLILIYAVTSVTTYIGLQEFPMASRELATGSVNYTPYYQRNIGGFTFIYSLVVLHPVFICALRSRKKTVLSIFLSVLFGICIFESKYTTGALTFIVSCIAYFLPLKQSNKNVRGRSVMVVLFLIIAYILAPTVLDWLSGLEILEASSDKITDIAAMLRGEEVNFEGTKARQRAYEKSWTAFMDSPIGGTRFFSSGSNGGHSFVLDTMANWGLLGFGVVYYILNSIGKYYKQYYKGSYIYYFVMLSFWLAIVLASLNALFWHYELGLVVPVFAYYALNSSLKTQQIHED